MPDPAGLLWEVWSRARHHCKSRCKN